MRGGVSHEEYLRGKTASRSWRPLTEQFADGFSEGHKFAPLREVFPDEHGEPPRHLIVRGALAGTPAALGMGGDVYCPHRGKPGRACVLCGAPRSRYSEEVVCTLCARQLPRAVDTLIANYRKQLAAQATPPRRQPERQCKNCGVVIVSSRRRGRPSVRCDECRDAKARAGLSDVQLMFAPRAKVRVRRASGPANPWAGQRFCPYCGSSDWTLPFEAASHVWRCVSCHEQFLISERVA